MSSNFHPWNTVDYKKVSRRQALMRWFSILLPVLLFLGGVYVIFVKWQKPPLALIEEYAQSHRYHEAYELATKFLDNDSISRPQMLMYAAAVEPAVTSSGKIGEYEKLLRKEDSGKLYLREMYLKRLTWLSTSELWLNWLCQFQLEFPVEASKYLSKNTVRDGVLSAAHWEDPGNECNEILVASSESPLSEYQRKLSGDRVNLRKCAGLECDPIGRLSKEEPVILRGREGAWARVYTLHGFGGYVAVQYLKNLP